MISTNWLSQRNRRHRLRHLAGPDVGQLLSSRRWQTELFSGAPAGALDPAGLAAEGSNQLSFAKPVTSAGTGFTPQHAESNSTSVLGDRRPSPAAFWLRNEQKVLSHVGSAKTLGIGPPSASPAGPCIAYLSRPLGTDHERERRDLSDWEDAPPVRWPGPDSGNLNADFQLSPTQPVARRSKAAPTVSAQPVQVRSPPPYASNSTVAQVSLESSSPPLDITSRLLPTCAWTQKDHTYKCVKLLFSQDILCCFVCATWTVLPRVRPGVKRKQGGITRRGFSFNNTLTAGPRLKLKSRRRK